MALGFIIGKSGYGKTHYCMKEVLANESPEHKQILITPDQYSSQAERDLLRMSKNFTTLNSEVLTFNRMAYRVFANSGINNKTILDDVSKSMTLQKILLEVQDSLIYFKKFIDKSGFIEQLSLTFTEFAKYKIDPDELFEISKTQNLPIIVQEKLKDICLIFSKYNDFLSQDYLPNDEKLTILSNLLDQENPFQTTTFYIDGFYDFTPQEIGVINKLLKYSKNVYVTLPMNQSMFERDYLYPQSPFAKSHQTKTRLIKLAEKVNPAIFLTKNHRSKKEGLENLEKHFFNGYYETCSLSSGVNISNSPTKDGEVVAIAGEIINLVKSGKARFKDISILTNDLEGFAPLFMSTLKAFDIPFFIDTKRSITTHSLITLIQSLLELIINNFSYKNMFAYLRTGLSNITEEEIDELENYVLAYGIKSYKWTSNKPWTYGLTPENQDKIENINQLREKVLTPLLPLIELGKNEEIFFKDLIKTITNHLKDLEINIKMTNLMNQSTENNNFGKANEHKQVFQMVFDLFEKTNHILGDTKLPLRHQQKILLAGILKYKIGVVPPSIDCVLVGDFERSRLPEVKYLFVAGVNEGILPSPSTSQGIFSEIERDIIASLGIEMAISAKQLAFYEQLLIYYGLVKPSEGLYISYFSGDLEGKPYYPSSLIHKLKYMDNSLEITTPEPFDINKNTPKTAITHLGRALNQEEITPLWSNMYNFYTQDEQWTNKVNILKSAICKTPPTQVLSKEAMGILYGKKIYSSVSKLERYNSCPYSYFMEYNLKAKPRKVYKLEAPDLGNLFHEVLEQFFTKFQNEIIAKLPIEQQFSAWNLLEKLPNKNSPTKSVKEYIDEIVDIVAEDLENGILMDSSAHLYLVNRLKRICLTSAWTCVKHIQEGDFRPVKYELEFGMGDSADLPPIKINLENKDQLFLTGKIDRIDLFQDGKTTFVKVVDYKSGSIKFDFQKIYHGLQLQLFMYMDAYLNSNSNSNPDTEIKPAGAFYFKISDPKIEITDENDIKTIDDALYKEMKMSGLCLRHEDIIPSLDQIFKSTQEDVSSSIIPLSYTKKGDISSKSMVATNDEFDNILKFTKEKVVEIGEQIKSGIISPQPYKQGTKTPCNYCRYKEICRYEYDILPKYNVLSKVSKEVFLPSFDKDVIVKNKIIEKGKEDIKKAELKGIEIIEKAQAKVHEKIANAKTDQAREKAELKGIEDMKKAHEKAEETIEKVKIKIQEKLDKLN